MLRQCLEKLVYVAAPVGGSGEIWRSSAPTALALNIHHEAFISTLEFSSNSAQKLLMWCVWQKLSLSRLLKNTSQLNIFLEHKTYKNIPKMRKILRTAARRRVAKLERGSSEQRREGGLLARQRALRPLRKCPRSRFALRLHPSSLPTQVGHNLTYFHGKW